MKKKKIKMFLAVNFSVQKQFTEFVTEVFILLKFLFYFIFKNFEIYNAFTKINRLLIFFDPTLPPPSPPPDQEKGPANNNHYCGGSSLTNVYLREKLKMSVFENGWFSGHFTFDKRKKFFTPINKNFVF